MGDRFGSGPRRRWADGEPRRLGPAPTLERPARGDCRERVLVREGARGIPGRSRRGLVQDALRRGIAPLLQVRVRQVIEGVRPLIPHRGQAPLDLVGAGGGRRARVRRDGVVPRPEAREAERVFDAMASSHAPRRVKMWDGMCWACGTSGAISA